MKSFPSFSVITDDDAGSFDEAGFDRVVQAEVADYPLKQGFFAAALACGSEGRRGEIEAGLDASRAMNAVKAADPFGRLFEFFFCDSLHGRFWVAAPGMVGFVVDDHDVLRSGHIFKNFTDVGFVAERPTFVHTFSFGDAFFGIPIQCVPIHNVDFALAQCVMKSRGMRLNSAK